MNALVKKEVRLIAPSCLAATGLALVQAITRPYDFYMASLLFFGLTLMALTTIGREASLNTFSSLVALPAERVRIWQTKLSVLAGCFVLVFLVWLAAFGLAFLRAGGDAANSEDSYNLFITICLIAMATFTGGLWTTLLLRQLASAFWLTLLVPATLSGFSGIFLAGSESDHLVIAVLSLVIGGYSLAGLLFARWLFFRAQDVGWSGGVIALPEWGWLFSRPAGAEAVRRRQPLFALLKKELQLHQGALTGALGLLVLHAAIIAFRIAHTFPKNSAGEGLGEILTSIVWVLWLLLPILIGSVAIAEERKLGVRESEFCLPVSRRLQFAVKLGVTVGLGLFLGGVMPVLLETIGVALNSRNVLFMSDHHPLTADGIRVILYGVTSFAAGLGVISLFASSLARNFLQAVSIGMVTFLGLLLSLPAWVNDRMHPWFGLAPHSPLPLVIFAPTIVGTLLWLTYRNFEDFRAGWPLWRRNLLALAGAVVFTIAGSIALYHRAWEMLEPAEPAHGPAQFSLAHPPLIHQRWGENGSSLQVQLPDGRVWFDRIGDRPPEPTLASLVRWSVDPLPRSSGPQRAATGSNWVSFAVRPISYVPPGQDTNARAATNRLIYLDSVGVQADGTLWVSREAGSERWNADQMVRFGNDTNWQSVSWPLQGPKVWLLKKDGTLWSWGPTSGGETASVAHWTALRDLTPRRIGTDSDWQQLANNSPRLRKVDGSVWWISGMNENGDLRPTQYKYTNWDQVDFEKWPPRRWNSHEAYVRRDGTLWSVTQQQAKHAKQVFVTNSTQIGKETNWISVVTVFPSGFVALKADGTLWSRGLHGGWIQDDLPTRLGIHQDWVAITGVDNGVVSLAADGSLWLWPGPLLYVEPQLVIKLPKQPRLLGNVLHDSQKS